MKGAVAPAQPDGAPSAGFGLHSGERGERPCLFARPARDRARRAGSCAAVLISGCRSTLRPSRSPISNGSTRFASHAANSKLFAGRLIVEITESAAVLDIKRTSEVLRALKELDIAIAIDGFGTGHASFSRPARAPIDIIKIDGAFVQDADRSSRWALLCPHPCRPRPPSPVARSWENGSRSEAAASVVEKLGVDYLQGSLRPGRVLGQQRRISEQTEGGWTLKSGEF